MAETHSDSPLSPIDPSPVLESLALQEETHQRAAFDSEQEEAEEEYHEGEVDRQDSSHFHEVSLQHNGN